MAKKQVMTKKFKRELFRRIRELDKFIKENYPEADYYSIGRFIDSDNFHLYLTQGDVDAYTLSDNICWWEVK